MKNTSRIILGMFSVMGFLSAASSFMMLSNRGVANNPATALVVVAICFLFMVAMMGCTVLFSVPERQEYAPHPDRIHMSYADLLDEIYAEEAAFDHNQAFQEAYNAYELRVQAVSDELQQIARNLNINTRSHSSYRRTVGHRDSYARTVRPYQSIRPDDMEYTDYRPPKLTQDLPDW